jgi:UDPglucose 6-dehydrogenase
MEQAKKVLENVTYTGNPYECAEGAVAITIATEWEQFRALDFDRLKKVMAEPIMVDLRNVYSQQEVARHGFTYASVGRGT